MNCFPMKREFHKVHLFLQGKAVGQMLLDFEIKNVPDLLSLSNI